MKVKSLLCISVLILSFFIFGTTNLRSEDHGIPNHHSPGKIPTNHGVSNEHHGEHDEAHTFTPLGAFNLTDGWLDAPELRHNTADGNPVIFPFVGLLTGYLSRDVFLDYSFLSLDDEDEHEFEIEVEIPLTRRIGFFIGTPYILIRPDGAGGGSAVSHLEEDPHHGEDTTHGEEAEHHSNEDGWGDLFFGPRIIVSETKYSSTTFNLEVKVPTGSKSVGTGKEVHLFPTVSHWQDFGKGLALHTQVGVDFGLKSDESELVYQVGVTKTLWKDFAIVAQLDGHTILDTGKHGRNVKGRTVLNGLVGLSYRFGGDLDLRSAYVFPLNSDSHLDDGVRAEIIKHF